MNLTITTSYIATPISNIKLPIKSWDEIKDWYVKWDVLHYTLNNETWNETPLNSSTDDIIDWKLPEAVHIYNEFDNILDSYH